MPVCGWQKPLSDRFRSKQQLIKEVIHLIEQESYTYADPMTQVRQGGGRN